MTRRISSTSPAASSRTSGCSGPLGLAVFALVVLRIGVAGGAVRAAARHGARARGIGRARRRRGECPGRRRHRLVPARQPERHAPARSEGSSASAEPACCSSCRADPLAAVAAGIALIGIGLLVAAGHSAALPGPVPILVGSRPRRRCRRLAGWRGRPRPPPRATTMAGRRDGAVLALDRAALLRAGARRHRPRRRVGGRVRVVADRHARLAGYRVRPRPDREVPVGGRCARAGRAELPRRWPAPLRGSAAFRRVCWRSPALVWPSSSRPGCWPRPRRSTPPRASRSDPCRMRSARSRPTCRSSSCPAARA